MASLITFDKIETITPETQVIFARDVSIVSSNNRITYDTPPINKGGSIVFTNSPSNTYLQIANDSNLALGSGSFTVEWFQYWTGSEANPRPFSIGTWNTAVFAVSYEAAFWVWVNGQGTNIGSIPSKNTWVHIALVGNGLNIKVYTNGTLTGTVNNFYNFSNTTTALCIGNETSPSSASCFKGNITNFRWVKGTQVYTGNFTVPTTPLTAISGTELLLLASSSTNFTIDSSSRARTVTNTGTSFSTMTPF